MMKATKMVQLDQKKRAKGRNKGEPVSTQQKPENGAGDRSLVNTFKKKFILIEF